MTDRTLEETETALHQSAADRSIWEMYTDDPVWIRRLDAIGAERIKSHHGGGATYRLRADQVVIRKGKRAVAMTEGRLAALQAGRRKKADALDNVQ